MTITTTSVIIVWVWGPRMAFGFFGFKVLGLGVHKGLGLGPPCRALEYQGFEFMGVEGLGSS